VGKFIDKPITHFVRCLLSAYAANHRDQKNTVHACLSLSSPLYRKAEKIQEKLFPNFCTFSLSVYNKGKKKEARHELQQSKKRKTLKTQGLTVIRN